MASTGRKLTIAGLAVGVIAVLVALGTWLLPIGSDGGDRVIIKPSGGVYVEPSIGDSGCVVIQGDCIITPGTEADADVESELKAMPSASLPPQGAGPWMFIVHGTHDLGLYVRDGFAMKDHRLPGEPTLAEGTAVYVDCRMDDGFVADRAAAEVGRWYKIRYPEVADSGDFWVYAGYTLPVGHNGQVPECVKAQRG